VRARAISAVAIVISVALLLWLGNLFWLAAVIVIAFVGVQELYAALRQNGYRPLLLVQALLTIGLPVTVYYGHDGLSWMVALVALTMVASPAAAMARADLKGSLADWAVSLTGALYVALLLSYFVALRQADQGLRWIVMAFLCTWACDSIAYLVGRAIGKRAFSPRISPNKTWEGTLGGVMGGTLAGLLAVPMLGLPALAGLLMGAAVAVAAIAGDLVESFIKRQLGIKDSGALIPGHGGVLDRVDSLLFGVPLVYYVMVVSAIMSQH
jgi:phosphatidate cytidylyltransferase